MSKKNEKKIEEKIEEKTVMVDGMMTFGKLDDGRHTADFMTYDEAVAYFKTLVEQARQYQQSQMNRVKN